MGVLLEGYRGGFFWRVPVVETRGLLGLLAVSTRLRRNFGMKVRGFSDLAAGKFGCTGGAGERDHGKVTPITGNVGRGTCVPRIVHRCVRRSGNGGKSPGRGAKRERDRARPHCCGKGHGWNSPLARNGQRVWRATAFRPDQQPEATIVKRCGDPDHGCHCRVRQTTNHAQPRG